MRFSMVVAKGGHASTAWLNFEKKCKQKANKKNKKRRKSRDRNRGKA